MLHIDTDRDAIAKVFEETYPHNVKTKDIAGYANMYTEDAFWMAPNQRDRRGIPDITEGFIAMIGDKDIDPVFTAEEVEVMGDFGYVNGISIATIHPHNGSPDQTAKYRALWLMRKEAGEWKIAQQIWNSKPV